MFLHKISPDEFHHLLYMLTHLDFSFQTAGNWQKIVHKQQSGLESWSKNRSPGWSPSHSLDVSPGWSPGPDLSLVRSRFKIQVQA